MERGECKRLFITCPPRHWKSSLASEKFPLFWLGRNPMDSVILCSYAVSLAEKFSRTVRDTITFNDRFQDLFPVRLNQGRGGVHDWSLVGAGRSSFRAVGVGGGITGSGGQLVLIDDPVADAKEASSATQRDTTWEWYKQTLRTRLEPDARIVLIMSRWHEDDLAGRLMKASRDRDGEAWEEIHLPAMDADGNPLWPERWPKAELEQLKLGVGNKAWSALYQGSPRQMEGAILNSGKLVMCNAEDVPPLVRVVRRWDLAFSDERGADWVAGAKMGIDKRGHTYILHIKRIHGRWPQSMPVIIELALADGQAVACLIEANGTQLGYYQTIKDDLRMRTRNVRPDKPEGNKEMRASLWGGRLEDGIIHCVRGDWNADFFDEMDFFPHSTNDDMVDAVSGGYNELNGGRRILVS